MLQYILTTRIKKHQAKTNHRTNLSQFTKQSKYWKITETFLTTESNYLLAKLALPIHPVSSLLIYVMLIYSSEF